MERENFEKAVINIQSISDIITNSSTEVFLVYDEQSLQDIKNLVNAILKLNGKDKTFDDYFYIKLTVDEGDIQDVMDSNEGMTYEDARQCVIDDYERSVDNGEPAYGRNFYVTPKCDEAKECAELLNNVDNLFDKYAAYC